MDLLEDRCRLLGIRSPIQKKAVAILLELQGYSKRLDLLHDQLRRELGREGIGANRINQQLTELLELGLAEERKGSEGVRLALNRDIWDLDLRVIEFVRAVTEHLASEMRSDTLFSGVLRGVKTKIRESKKLPVEIGHGAYEVLVCCALRRHPDWEFIDGKVVRKYADTLPREGAGQNELFIKEDKDAVKAEKSSGDADKNVASAYIAKTREGIELPQGISFELTPLESLVSSTLLGGFERDSVKFVGSTVTVDVSLSLGRRQRVFVTLRRSAAHEKVFWLFSICGMFNPVRSNLANILWHNNECDQFKVTCMEIEGEMHVGVCSVLASAPGWQQQLPVMIRGLAAFGDRLEEIHWSRDDF
jgi:hypothetical protein